MSERIPESIPTSADPRSKRPLKKRALTPSSSQAASVTALFAKPDQEIRLPPSSNGVGVTQTAAAPPEIVANVQGSSAGAGSGEFHVYKASRRREYERLKGMDEEVRREKEAEEFDRAKTDRETKDAEKTRKNREKREKLKARRGKGGKVVVEEKDEKTEGVKGPRIMMPVAGEEHHENGEAMEGMQEAGLIIHDDD